MTLTDQMIADYSYYGRPDHIESEYADLLGLL
jgi:hypothetical protein